MSRVALLAIVEIIHNCHSLDSCSGALIHLLPLLKCLTSSICHRCALDTVSSINNTVSMGPLGSRYQGRVRNSRDLLEVMPVKDKNILCRESPSTAMTI